MTKMHLDAPTPTHIHDFLAGPATPDPQSRELFNDVWRTYLKFCDTHGHRTLGRSTFGYFLARHGITAVRGSRNKCYRDGIRITR